MPTAEEKLAAKPPIQFFAQSPRSSSRTAPSRVEPRTPAPTGYDISKRGAKSSRTGLKGTAPQLKEEKTVSSQTPTSTPRAPRRAYNAFGLVHLMNRNERRLSRMSGASESGAGEVA